mmetsp:Transcript_10879/g.29108  ORF Transcript_10879/g.29108 Transcript_10879/m.29108 type:complete len:207 (-) Transcript_10879:183-803(-)
MVDHLFLDIYPSWSHCPDEHRDGDHGRVLPSDRQRGSGGKKGVGDHAEKEHDAEVEEPLRDPGHEPRRLRGLRGAHGRPPRHQGGDAAHRRPGRARGGVQPDGLRRERRHRHRGVRGRNHALAGGQAVGALRAREAGQGHPRPAAGPGAAPGRRGPRRRRRSPRLPELRAPRRLTSRGSPPQCRGPPGEGLSGAEWQDLPFRGPPN